MPSQTILITRPKKQGEKSADFFQKHGFNTVCFPVLEIIPQFKAEINSVKQKLVAADIIIVTSYNAVDNLPVELFANLQQKLCIAIGSATKAELDAHGCQNIHTPPQFNSEEIGRAHV